MKKRILSILLVLVLIISFGSGMVFANTAEFAGGSGTENDPFLISNKTQLNNVRNYLDAHFKLTCDIEFRDDDFESDGDFYNNEQGWAPIGTYDEPFSGSFDGNGCVIENLYIKIISDKTVYAGLFGYLDNATVKNLGMVDCDIYVKTSSSGSFAFAGAITGANGYIVNCYNTGDIYAHSLNCDSYAGGIAGSSKSFEKCYNTGTVTATTYNPDESIQTMSYAGGIAGFGTYAKNCYNSGSVSAENYCGGIFCYSYSCEISDCYNAGTVSDAFTCGGIIAYATSILELSNAIIIRNCYNTGTVIATLRSGGIVGASAGRTKVEITDCYNAGSVVTTTHSFGASSGGIIANNSTAHINSCYNTGNVTASSTVNLYSYAGGIAGVNTNNMPITNCYNTGRITSSSSIECFGGGIAGDNNGEISYCYSVGTVIAPVSSETLVGGIVGNSTDDKTYNCYFLDNINTNHQSGDIYNVYRKKTTEQLKIQSTYSGFDFETVWGFATEGDYLYPILKSNHTHIFSNSCDKSCSFCDFTRIAEHVYGEYLSDNNATCVADGTKTATCTADGCEHTDTITDVGSKDGVAHSWGEYVYNNDASYDTDGTKTAICTVDGCQASDTLTADGTNLELVDSTEKFIDVKKGDWFKTAIDYALSTGIMNGVSNVEMKPNHNLTRAQFAQILANIEGVDTTNRNVTTKFQDVPSGQWFSPAVKWANENGIVEGNTPTTFAPNGTLTRENMCLMIVRYLNSKDIALEITTEKANFDDDASIGNWAKDAVYECQMSGLVTGIGDSFKPKNTATRAQVATIMMRTNQKYKIVK